MARGEVRGQRLERDLGAISSCNTTPERGVTRLTFSEAYVRAREYVLAEMTSIGMATTIDEFGNVFGILSGEDDSLPAVMAGSHIDSVPNGGRFDGVAGCIAALEVARCLRDTGKRRRTYIVVIFAEEDGGRFGEVVVGSRAFTGELSREEVHGLKDANGITYGAALARSLPSSALSPPGRAVARNDVGFMFELHIEQSKVLESEGCSIGIVQSVAGLTVVEVEVRGDAGHAGATPMHLRRDALVAAAEMIVRVEESVRSPSGASTVATVGVIDNEPNASNVIPGRVRFLVDVRDTDPAALDTVTARLVERVRESADSRGVHVEIGVHRRTAPRALSKRLVGLMQERAESRGVPYRLMSSGAVHDAAVLAGTVDAGMIFVPSKDGRSHAPDEWTSRSDIETGTRLLLDTVRALCDATEPW